MSFLRRMIGRFRSQQDLAGRRRRLARQYRPQLELLEDRVAPAVGPSVGNDDWSLAADNIVLDGFTIEGNTGGTLGAGIVTSASFSGYQIRNNIIQDNTIGLYLNSSGDFQTVVEQNLIRDNNNAGVEGGTGLYSD